MKFLKDVLVVAVFLLLVALGVVVFVGAVVSFQVLSLALAVGVTLGAILVIAFVVVCAVRVLRVLMWAR